MRLDFFLKTSRLVKRRTLAKEYCLKGWIQINNHTAKPSTVVREGDLISLYLWSRKKIIKVIQIPDKIVSRKNMPELYQVIEDIKETKDANL